MTTTAFKLFYDWQGSSNLSAVIYAENPEEAARKLRKQAPGAVIHKTKRDKSGNVSPRVLNKRDAATQLSERYKVINHQ